MCGTAMADIAIVQSKIVVLSSCYSTHESRVETIRRNVIIGTFLIWYIHRQS